MMYYFLFLGRKPKINCAKKGDSGLDPSSKTKKRVGEYNQLFMK